MFNRGNGLDDNYRLSLPSDYLRTENVLNISLLLTSVFPLSLLLGSWASLRFQVLPNSPPNLPPFYFRPKGAHNFGSRAPLISLVSLTVLYFLPSFFVSLSGPPMQLTVVCSKLTTSPPIGPAPPMTVSRPPFSHRGSCPMRLATAPAVEGPPIMLFATIQNDK